MPNPRITPEMIYLLAARANFSFQITDYSNLNYGGYNGEVTNIAGSGVETLDEVKGWLDRPFPSRITAALDFGSLQSNFQMVDSDDIAQIRAVFVSIYGEVNKPDVYRPIPYWASTF
jgi:hypothetical protein